MSQGKAMKDDPFYMGIHNQVESTVADLVLSVRQIGEDDLLTWQKEAANWFYEKLVPTPRNHHFREWFIHRSLTQLTGLDALETSCLHMAVSNHPSPFITPKRLIADKKMQTPPQSGINRFWVQERKLQTAVVQLIEERGWQRDSLEEGILAAQPLFQGRLMRDDTNRPVVVMGSRDTDPATGTIGIIDSHQLSLAIHDARKLVPVRTGGIVTIDSKSLAVSWHETFYDEALGGELARLREDFWQNHVLEDKPLSAMESNEGDANSGIEDMDDQLQHDFNILVLQHCLGVVFRDIANEIHQESRKILQSFITENGIAYNKYDFGDFQFQYQLVRNSDMVRETLKGLEIPLDRFRRPLKPGESGEINRLPLISMLAELKALQKEGDESALLEGIGRLLQIPLELGPLDVKKATDHLRKTGLVADREIHGERLKTSVTHASWEQQTELLRKRAENFFENQVISLNEILQGQPAGKVEKPNVKS